jgi:hypothetical protein
VAEEIAQAGEEVLECILQRVVRGLRVRAFLVVAEREMVGRI